MKIPGGHRPKRRIDYAERCHGLEHLLAGIIRKYGDDEGRRVTLEEETFVGGHTIRLSTSNGAILIEVVDREDREMSEERQ
jgi:hypothetical protein